jgi:hypothetical protein
MINPKLGYYTCNGITFDSKIAACVHSVQHNNAPVTWTFNDAEFSKHDWTTEPEQTLDELYDARARQLREQYDYLILSYSGGADSHNILMSFVRQDLLIDEIVVNTTEKASAKFTELNKQNMASTNAAAEHLFQTMPRLQEIQSRIPKTKISIMDLSDCVFESFSKAEDASWVLEKREGLNPAGVVRFNYLHFDQLRKQFDKGKKIALMLGIEKPRVTIRNGQLILQFSDRIANIITVAEHIKDYENSTAEFFYWSPDAVPIIIKQAHVIKRWLEANPSNQSLWDADNQTSETFRLVHERVYRPLLYTTWNNNWWQADKAVHDWSSEFDQWFEDGYSDTAAYRVWTEGVDYVRTTLEPFLHTKRLVNGKADGLNIFFKEYSLGTMKRLSPELKNKLYNRLTNK